MKAEIVSETTDHVVLSLDMTRREMDLLAKGNPSATMVLTEAVLAACRAAAAASEPNELDPASEKPEQPFRLEQYKNIRIRRIVCGENDESPEDLMKEKLLDGIIESNDIPIPPEQIENEVHFEMIGRSQTLKYQGLMNRDLSLYEAYGTEEDRLAVERDVIRHLKVEKILKSVIEQEQLTATKAELRHLAMSIAQRQQIGNDMIERFFGQDLELLERDVLRTKALDLIYQTACIVDEAEDGSESM